jgi:hypothetical protein
VIAHRDNDWFDVRRTMPTRVAPLMEMVNRSRVFRRHQANGTYVVFAALAYGEKEIKKNLMRSG